MEHGRFELNQGARIRSVKSDDRYRSFDSHTSKASSLQQDDDRFPSYVQLYKSMIVKCVECNHLLPRMRDIFEDQDFMYVAKALEKRDIIDKEVYTTQRRLIDVFACELYKKLKPSEIIVDLFSKKVLNKEMLEAVKLEEQNKGELSATIVLIDNIWRCNENWYSLFLEVLCKHEYKDLVMEIDPLFLEGTLEAAESVTNISENFPEESLDEECINELLREIAESLNEPPLSERKPVEDDGSLPLKDDFKMLKLTTDSSLESKERIYLDHSDDEEESVNPKEELKLRSYQMELARPSLEGKNAIIVAPTGSGKTHVALCIIKHHMETIKSIRHPKVIFLVEQSALAEQQGKQCMTYLPFKVKVITGESQRNERMKSLNEWIARRDLLVVTAQILLNALRDGIVSVTDFSLMVFDECHHTNDNHSYNMIMNRYLDLKLQDRERAKTLPMVLGLTASVGVGRATMIVEAKRHIEKIMANMDAESIATVIENTTELEKYVIIPKQNLERVQKLETVLKPPLEKGSDQYTQWVSMLWRETAKINNKVVVRFFETCRKYLDLYNKALIIYEDARPSDALAYIFKEFKKWKHTVKADDTERIMRRMFDEIKSTLEDCSIDPCHRNPKLTNLRDIIGEHFRENPGARVIVFVKTRELAKAMETYMNETKELSILKPIQFVGVQANRENGGMTKVQQDETLELFKEGNHKVIIATSVAEEGLDILKCSLVVRYDHVTNEIAMVQSRGRGRSENSIYVVLASENSKTLKREEGNRIREAMMNRAIDKVRAELSTDEEAVLRRVREIQQAEKVTRDVAIKNRKVAQANFGAFEITCNSCQNMICMSTDIKKIQDNHHAALNEDILENVQVNCAKPYYEDDLISCGAGKVLCKNCGDSLGNVSVYKKAQFCILKCEKLKMIDKDGNSDSKKKWKKAPFTVPPLTQDDLERRIQGEKYVSS
uniref:RNA helicase n=1 Tax=Magallana gigas TaxID=29159 RepID=K1QX86_MAGGI